LATEETLKENPDVLNKTLYGDVLKMLEFVPDNFADLIIIDPPYNLTKNFNGFKFNSRSDESFDEYLSTWFPQVCKKLKPNGSLYMCGDWKCTSSLQRAIEKELFILNRITWQREKGRGAKSNWKNGMEDIWFAVKNPKDYYFDVESVKMKRKVIAPYKVDGKPKDWDQSEDGNFRITYPSNFWDDISIPFWSMPENTDHPTQKPEKLYAKLILASSKSGDIVFDPFLGSGTTSLAAKNLERNSIGYEINQDFKSVISEKCCTNDNESIITFETDNFGNLSSYEKLPYIFKDPHKLDKITDIKKLYFGSKIDGTEVD
jgi:site-specific DNA-methyltransferase (adenine-specific)